MKELSEGNTIQQENEQTREEKLFSMKSVL